MLIDTAGRFTTQDSDRENDSATWSGFLALLKKLAAAPAGQRRAGHGVGHRPADAQRSPSAPARRHRARSACRSCTRTSAFASRSTCWSPSATCWPASWTTSRRSTRTSVPRRGASPSRCTTRCADGLAALRRRIRRARDSASTTAWSTACRPSATRSGAPASTASLASSPACAACCRSSSRRCSRPRPTRPTRCCAACTSSAARRKARRSTACWARSRAATGSSGPSSRRTRPAAGATSCTRLLGEVVFAESGLAGTDLKWERRRRLLALAGYAAMAALSVGADHGLGRQLSRQPALRERCGRACRPGAPAGASHAEPRLARHPAHRAGARSHAQAGDGGPRSR